MENEETFNEYYEKHNFDIWLYDVKKIYDRDIQSKDNEISVHKKNNEDNIIYKNKIIESLKKQIDEDPKRINLQNMYDTIIKELNLRLLRQLKDINNRSNIIKEKDIIIQTLKKDNEDLIDGCNNWIIEVNKRELEIIKLKGKLKNET